MSDLGRPQLKITNAVWKTNGENNDVTIYYDTLRIDAENKSVTAIQEGDKLEIDLSTITGVSSFNLLRESGYTPDNLEFRSMDETVATVGNDGVVDAVGTGITYIIVTDTNSGAEGFFKLNVVPHNV